jgi:GDP-mannose 6-dehydrogenase
MKVAVIGLGYVGTVTAACLAANGHDVWGADIDDGKIAEIQAGRSPVAEPGLDEIVARAVAGGSLHATTSTAEAVSGAELSLVCVGTPSTARGAADLSFIKRAVEDIPGTVDEVVLPALTAGVTAPGLAVGAAMCPEFLREGSGVADFFAPPMIVAGTSDPLVAGAVTNLLAFIGQPVQIVAAPIAEALKYACNAFHATKVSFANEIARLLRLLDVDARQVMELFCQDQVLNISPSYLRPGFAFGGSCLPKDLRSLLHMARMNGADLPLLSATLATNDLSVSEVVDRVVACDAKVIALFGLSFKMSTDDLRESPNVELAERLIGKGYEVRIYDHVVNPDRLVGTNRRYVESKLPHLGRLLAHQPGDALQGADVAIVSTSDAAVLEALLAAPPQHLIDLTGRLGEQIESLSGYQGIGW